MKIKEFINNCVEEQFKWIKREDAVLIKKGELELKVPHKTILAHPWSKLIKQIGAFDVYHMTRVVGYYSRVQNWNPSKIGELKDRQAGKYEVK